MRPSNLKEVASSVVEGMSRSINRSAQPIEEESREGSRKGATYGELRDMLPTNGDADEEDRIFKEVGFDDTTEEADVFFRALEGDPGSSYIFEQTIGRSGGRKGSRKGATREEVIDEIFDGDEILYD